MRTKLLLGALAIGLSAAVLPTPAWAGSAADCPYGSVTGNVVYTPALTPTVPTVAGQWAMQLNMNCVGTSPSAGVYSLNLIGGNNESCTTGTANGTVTGTGPNGAVTGTAGYQRFGIHLYGFPPYATSTFSSGGKAYTLALWLDVFGPVTGGTNVACPLAAGTIIGHAAVVEL